jgi:hypothetical protein
MKLGIKHNYIASILQVHNPCINRKISFTKTSTK